MQVYFYNFNLLNYFVLQKKIYGKIQSRVLFSLKIMFLIRSEKGLFQYSELM